MMSNGILRENIAFSTTHSHGCCQGNGIATVVPIALHSLCNMPLDINMALFNYAVYLHRCRGKYFVVVHGFMPAKVYCTAC